MMAGIGGKDTKPELTVRGAFHAAGLRYRLHRRDLPGSPDIVLAQYRAVVFVHGCFWHRHSGCRYATTPESNPHFWRSKFEENVERDARQRLALKRLGWRVLVVWECQVRKRSVLDALITRIKTVGTTKR